MIKKITYRGSGVDIDQANAFVRAIGRSVATTQGDAVIKRKGAFAGLYELFQSGLRNPVLVSSTDGVGTKLLIAKHLHQHDTVGIDLVAMNVNDILCVGGRPLFFLDYIACGKLDRKVLQNVIKGIVKGCRISGCSLIGGETAEMPDLYRPDEYDLAGFAVGVVDKDKIIDGSTISTGDQILGLPSSGLHSNGFSLVRKVFSAQDQKRLAKTLLKPTRIYVDEILRLIQKFPVKGLAHITGGAFYDKLTKILPSGKCFLIRKGSWPVLKIFKDLQQKGQVDDFEMYRTFNMGIGMAMVVDAKHVTEIKSFFSSLRMPVYHIGEVVTHKTKRIEFTGTVPGK